MILLKHLTAEEVLSELAQLAQQTLPENSEGTLHLEFDDDDGVEIYFIPENDTLH